MLFLREKKKKKEGKESKLKLLVKFDKCTV